MERTISKQIGYSHVDYIVTDTQNGQYLDTKVILNDQLLCVIAGCDLLKFHNELKELVNKYRI